MAPRKGKTLAARTPQQPLQPTPTPPLASPTATAAAAPDRPSQAAADLRRAARFVEQTRQQAEARAKVAALPVQHPHAAGIDVGDASHWVCVETTPDGSDTVREFPAHTAGLRQLVAWLRPCGVTTIALEATGVYGHVLFLTLLEAGFETITAPPQFARQIKGRPKTDRRDCQWIQRLHRHGLLPSVFQPDDATHTLRDYVRQREPGAPQRPARPTHAEGPRTDEPQADQGAGRRYRRHRPEDPPRRPGRPTRSPKAGPAARPALPRTAAEMAEALDGRYRPEHVTELRCCLAMWEKYQEVIGQLDGEIAAHLRTMRRRTELPPLPPKTRLRGRKPHDPRFDVRTALYYATGIDLTAIEGIDELHALTLVSELGTDFTKWPTVKQFASWLGLCPNWRKTGGKVQSSRTRRGKNRAAHALRLAAWSLMRSSGALGSYLRRQRSRLGAPKAITATAHKLCGSCTTWCVTGRPT